MPDLVFPDRASAGRLLAAELVRLSPARPVVYALPRGGVPVGVEIAKALQAPLDLLLVRKIGVPWHKELAAGSIVDGERPDIVINEDVVRGAHMNMADIEAGADEELAEIERRRAQYLPGRKPISAKGRTAILVDDGIATGASMRVAIMAVRRREPASVVVATPVASPDALFSLRPLADKIVCLSAPEQFRAVGVHYRDFHQLEDSEVIALLASSAEDAPREAQPSAP